MGSRVDYARSLPRGLSHPFTHVVFDVDGHTHIYAAGGGEAIEEMAEGLAEAVLRCSPEQHQGHGRRHTPEAAELAYKDAIRQLLTRDYWQEFVDHCRRVERYQMWGGPVPSLVFQPRLGNPRELDLFVTHPETGLPTRYELPKNALELPPPHPRKYHQGAYGYHRKGRNY